MGTYHTLGAGGSESPQVVILCGGRGMRLNERTESIPKPMVEIGGMPILWHIMKIYSAFGFKDFILCLGYKGEKIREFFMDLNEWRRKDFTLRVKDGARHVSYHTPEVEDWTITFGDTGLETNTGGRIKQVEQHITTSPFFVTYGDGLADINLRDLLAYHTKTGRIGTMTCVQPRTHFGIVEIDDSGVIVGYHEKPLLSTRVNGGFFVFNREVFSYIEGNEILEKEPFERLVRGRNLTAYCFDGFWMCMDTYKDTQTLNELYLNGHPPWKVW